MLCASGEDDVVDGDEHKFDEVADETHHNKAHTAGIQDLEVLCLGGLLALGPEVLTVSGELLEGSRHGLGFILDTASFCHLFN